jgi:hypothetical protein
VLLYHRHKVDMRQPDMAFYASSLPTCKPGLVALAPHVEILKLSIPCVVGICMNVLHKVEIPKMDTWSVLPLLPASSWTWNSADSTHRERSRRPSSRRKGCSLRPPVCPPGPPEPPVEKAKVDLTQGRSYSRSILPKVDLTQGWSYPRSIFPMVNLCFGIICNHDQSSARLIFP